MRQEKSGFRIGRILAVLALAVMLPTAVTAASKFKVLHRFNDGGFPVFTGLIFDTAGSLYGTTAYGATYGEVFKLKPNSEGTWTESVIYRFKGGADGAGPRGGLIFDVAGNLYGTTTYGGNPSCKSGCGTVFELTPSSNGTWTKGVLHSFAGRDGANPIAGLIFDTAGNLYGTTSGGGSFCKAGCGVVFKLAPNSDGTWSESVLHTFTGADGSDVFAGVIFDSAGNLYGTTQDGGAPQAGVVFKLTPNSDGSWTESVLHSFCSLKNCADGVDPVAGLIFDGEGNLYGTTASGGIYWGVVFKLKPNSDGSWTESVLHEFADNPGAEPSATLTFDTAGNLCGTTSNLDGSPNGGMVFEMTPNLGGGWEYGTLHVFRGKPALHPAGGLIIDNAGNLYGMTSDCGNGENCQGVVFEVSP